MRQSICVLAGIAAISIGRCALAADTFNFSTGNPDGKIGVLSRPSSGGLIEHEAGDDFLLNNVTSIRSATFTGLLNGATASDTGEVVVEIYRVFPQDSTFPPSGHVPARANSPSDVAFTSRDSAANELSFTAQVLTQNFTVANSVVNGIHASPNQTTQGEGAVSGQEVQYSVDFTTPIDLAPGHYFFVPQVQTTPTNSEFLWISAPKPIVTPGTPFLPDLQMWTRDENLAPDWLRVGTDIIGPINGVTPTFNGTFSLTGDVVPLPAAWKMAAPILLLLAGSMMRRTWRDQMRPNR